MKTPIRSCAAALLLLSLTALPALAQSKKELVNKLVLLQQPSVEAMARGMAEQPAIQLTMQARQLIEKVPAEKRDAVIKAIDTDLKKYVDETVPLLRDRAVKLAPTVIGSELESNFNEDELKQLIAWFESPVIKRFQQLAPGMQRTLTEKLVNETRAQVEPKLSALEAAMAKQLGVTPANAGGATGSPGAAPAAAGPGNRGAGEAPRK